MLTDTLATAEGRETKSIGPVARPYTIDDPSKLFRRVRAGTGYGRAPTPLKKKARSKADLV